MCILCTLSIVCAFSNYIIVMHEHHDCVRSQTLKIDRKMGKRKIGFFQMKNSFDNAGRTHRSRTRSKELLACQFFLSQSHASLPFVWRGEQWNLFILCSIGWPGSKSADFPFSLPFIRTVPFLDSVYFAFSFGEVRPLKIITTTICCQL